MQTPNYAALTVHTEAQKYPDDLQAMLDINWRIKRVAGPGDSLNVWQPVAKSCKWMKKHLGYTQERAGRLFVINTLEITEANLNGYFLDCPSSFYEILIWLFSEAKERSLDMHVACF